MFLRLKSLFFDTIFLKKSLSFWGAETPFSSKNSPSIFQRGKSLLNLRFFANFTKKFKLLISLDLKLLEVFWGHFWTFYVIWVFATEIIDFWLDFFRKVILFLRGWQAFPVINFYSLFYRSIPPLNFQIYDFWEKLICSYLLIKGS